MEKTKLGISAGLLAAAVWFTGLFSGYLVMILLTGYVLLREENVWLKRTCVKAIALSVCFSLLLAMIGILPDFLSIFNDLLTILHLNFSTAVSSAALDILTTVIDIAETIIFVIFAFLALGEKEVKIPVIDDLINKHMA